MADEELMEEMDNEGALITLEDEEGNEVEFEFLDVVEYEGEEYIVLIENDEDADEVVILKICLISCSIFSKANTRATSTSSKPLPRWAIRDRCRGGQSALLMFDGAERYVPAL